jgi:hypothetical protein
MPLLTKLEELEVATSDLQPNDRIKVDKVESHVISVHRAGAPPGAGDSEPVFYYVQLGDGRSPRLRADAVHKVKRPIKE